nr:DUF4118 domain-containing protein [uncultured Roseococcus sp.]
MAGPPRGPARGLALGAASFAVAFLLRQAASIEGAPFASFFLAIGVTAAFADWRPAAAVLTSSVAAIWYFVLPPDRSFDLLWPQGAVAVGSFALVAGALIVLVELVRAGAAQLRAQREEIDRLLAHERHLRQELQHRMASSIQSLAAVLSLQASRVSSVAEAQVALADAVQRLHNVALVHRRMKDPELAGERLAEALDALTLDLLRSVGRSDVAVEVVVEASPLEHGAAILVAMTVVEAVMNSVRHGFGDRPGGTISVALRQEGATLSLAVGDDGQGLCGVLQDAPRFGVTIMEGFAQRLGGEFHLENVPGGGARAVLNFPSPATQRPIPRLNA